MNPGASAFPAVYSELGIIHSLRFEEFLQLAVGIFNGQITRMNAREPQISTDKTERNVIL
jgi:hypothetical protein